MRIFLLEMLKVYFSAKKQLLLDKNFFSYLEKFGSSLGKFFFRRKTFGATKTQRTYGSIYFRFAVYTTTSSNNRYYKNNQWSYKEIQVFLVNIKKN